MNQSEQTIKRVFFGLEVGSTWPARFPKGRLLTEEARHMTLAFLGNVEVTPLKKYLANIPVENLRVGWTGYFDKLLLLPPKHPRVIAWHASVRSADKSLLAFREKLLGELERLGYSIDRRPFLPHVTLARAPFEESDWKSTFQPLPFQAFNLHLYESLGNLKYQPIWTHALLPPFQEISHTADEAFLIRGETYKELQTNAETALAFRYPEICNYFELEQNPSSLDEVITGLNRLIARVDSDIGSYYKAVSYSGEMTEANGVLNWEMIVDV